jgi:hypothetical protein
MDDLTYIEKRAQLATEKIRHGIFEYNIERVRCVDAMASDCGEGYEYYYDFIDYKFSGLGMTLFARQYKDEPYTISFVAVSCYGRQKRHIKRTDFRTRTCRAAIEYFSKKDITQQKYRNRKSNSGYSPIPKGNGILYDPASYIVLAQLLLLIALFLYMWP